MNGRRQFLCQTGHNLVSVSLTTLLCKCGLASDKVADDWETWQREYLRLGSELREAPLKQSQWQDGIDRLFARIPQPAFETAIDFAAIQRKLATLDLTEKGEIFHTIDLEGTAGSAPGPEPKRRIIAKIARIAKGRSIPPHGHSNMVSAFLNLSGEFHVRQYDRVAFADAGLVIRQTEDRVCGAGAWSSISDDRNNVHWLTAKSDDCYLFTTKLIGLVEGRANHGRINVDVTRAKALGDGKLIAGIISGEEAAERY